MQLNPGSQNLRSAPGSFGMPADMKESVRREEAKLRTPKEDQAPPPPPPAADMFGNTPATPIEDETSKAVTEEIALQASPTEMLKKLGMELKDEDIHNYVFKGFVEKDYLAFTGMGDKKFLAHLKTLTTAEVDEAEELLAEEVQTHAMLSSEVDRRRITWILAYGVTHINNMPVVRPVEVEGKKGEIDVKETIRARRKVLRGLAPMIINKLSIAHATLTAALNQTFSDREHSALKK